MCGHLDRSLVCTIRTAETPELRILTYGRSLSGRVRCNILPCMDALKDGRNLASRDPQGVLNLLRACQLNSARCARACVRRTTGDKSGVEFSPSPVPSTHLCIQPLLQAKLAWRCVFVDDLIISAAVWPDGSSGSGFRSRFVWPFPASRTVRQLNWTRSSQSSLLRRSDPIAGWRPAETHLAGKFLA